MSMISRLAGALVLLLAASIAQAQNKVPAELALEALVEPARVNFELEFIPSDAEWRMVLIHVKLGDPS
ncbi:MAG: hypothetical protein ACXWLB_13455 [Reyranella sp.]